MWEYLDEVLAVIIVIGCICLISLGIDSEVKSILTVACGWVFGDSCSHYQAYSGGDLRLGRWN